MANHNSAQKKSAPKRQIVEAKADKRGNIVAVRFKDNSTFTNLDTAVRLAERNLIADTHVVHSRGKRHIRTNPDNKIKNNLDEMAK